jgi:glycosyltransferase involved in cell wall biosynthesis
MKLSFVTANLGAGGAERVTSLLANQFCQKGYDVEIVFFRDRLIFYELDDRVKIIVIGEKCQSNAMWRKMLWLRSYVKKEKPDVVIPFRVSVYCITILSLLGLSVPIIASERIDPHIPDSYWTCLRKLLLPFVKHLVVQTEYIKSYYPKFIQKKTTVIPNPVRGEVFISPNGLQVQGANAVSSVQSSNTPIEGKGQEKLNRIISVGRLYPQKNQEMMIRAFAKIADEFPHWQLVIYGEGPLRAELEFLVSSFKLQNRVLLPGRTEHVIEELRKSKIFCMSSDYEGMSNAVVEAFCVGLPIITTKVSGTEDFINDGENGFLLDIGDTDGMEKAMRILMSNDVLRRRMGEKSRSEADQFEMKRIFQQWVDVVNKVENHKN